MNTQQITTLLTTSVQAAGFRLWGHEWNGAGDNRCLRVYIDHSNGISVDDCAVASRQISATLMVDDPVSDYQLEVSSPGLDRPLYTVQHYRDFIGREVKIRLRVPNESGQRRFRGVIAVVDGEEITLESQQGTITLTIDAIEKARLVVDW